jgi:hypothetical protein
MVSITNKRGPTKEAAEEADFSWLGFRRGFYETAGGVNGFLVFFVRRFLFFAFGEAALLYGGFISDFYPHSGGVA